MPVEILMPELGESVHEGTVSRWLKKEGDAVKEDEPVVEIMTDKVNTELPAPATGILSKILIPEGGAVEVFHPMGLITPEGEAAATAKADAPKAKPKAKEAEAPPPAAAAAAPAATATDRRWFTPVVRAMAKQHGIADDELASLTGRGEGGRVTKRDLDAYLQTRSGVAVAHVEARPALADSTTKLAGMRKMIADAMVRSSQVPTVSTLAEVDVTKMVLFREANKDSFPKQFGVKLTYTPFFIKAVTDAISEFPLLNASLEGDQIHMHGAVHMGVAVALGAKGDQGLIVPVIRDCQAKDLVQIARDLDDIAAKARASALSVQDVQGGTVTFTNPGSYGAVLGTPMINAPQAAILGAYAIAKAPVIVDDMIAIRSVCNLVLTYDHRLIDGLLAGRFLQAVKQRLERFEFFR